MTMDERVAKIIAIVTSMPASSAAPLISAGIREAVEAERHACADIVHDRLGADGYGVAKLIRNRS